MDDVAIKVENVSKTFNLPHEKQSSIKSFFINAFRRKKGYELQKALEDVSFEVKKGEFFGIVGRNGSGKSTMLKLLAGIYEPSTGSVQVNGKLTPFIELGVGFNQELTGRENVYLNGALLGFNRKEMKAMYKEIVAFAELGKFMDQKLKNYSSGMQVRLAFSIAIRAQSDILLIDEVLAVGDAAFQRKCFNYFAELKKNKRTVVFVSHDMESIRRYCEHVVLIDRGQVKAQGKASDVIPQYLKAFMDEMDSSLEASKKSDSDRVPLGMSTVVNIDKSVLQIQNAWLENEKEVKTNQIKEEDDHFYVKFKIKALKDVADIVPGVIITDYQGEFITASNSKWVNYQQSPKITKGKSYIVAFKMLNIYENGDYKISINVVAGDFDTFYAWENEITSAHFNREHLSGGKVNPKYSVKIESQS